MDKPIDRKWFYTCSDRVGGLSEGDMRWLDDIPKRTRNNVVPKVAAKVPSTNVHTPPINEIPPRNDAGAS